LAAESATDIPLSFLFNTKRLNRLVEYQAENNGLGIDDMIEVLTSKFESKKSRRFGRINTKQNEQMLLTYLLAVSINDNASCNSSTFKSDRRYQNQSKIQLKKIQR
jgi:hypothetical protein